MRPIVAHWLQEKKKKDEIGTSKEREGEIRCAQVPVHTHKEAGGKGAMQIFIVIQSVEVWKVFKHSRKLHVSPHVEGLAFPLFAHLI